ncbi:CBS domain-containing protein [Hydrogenivirga sp. 128-5-R1-1]|uniref:CBS domain-containing protein n=1 Tax=Hydrogenivirga sp. 128-5-R1-1 TaxID=392423 RepID=UPI00015F17D3|nr:CBS domain-containing protein [Hydrogenivirga sp. 128-5-R1-1]EDP76205.1 poly A polymerase [Hydrogenivirga sp. 128-5-R1-1]
MGQECSKVIVLSDGADLDALSAALALQRLSPDSCLLTPRYLSKRAGEVFRDFRHLFRTTDDLPERFTLVLTDTRHFPESIPKDRVEGVVVYDHHPEGDVKEFEGKVDRVGAATTLVVEELIERNIELSPEEATVIALGIYEDTGNFTYEGTTDRDLKAASWLLSMGADLKSIRKYMLEAFTKEQIDIVRRILSSIEKLFIEDREIVIATAVLEKYEPDINALLYEVKDLKEADAFFVIIEAEGKTYVFGRSQTKDIDAGKVLSHFGGGGHPEAGATKLENVSAERVKNLLIGYLKGLKPPKLRVGDIMSSPPFMLSEHLSVRDALLELSERGFANAPVIDREGNLIGIVSKKSLLKLSRLYPEEPVGEFVNKDFTTLSPDSPVWEAEEILTKFGQKLIPVVDGGTVVGVVTRLDILHRMKEDLGEAKALHKRIRIPKNIEEISTEVGIIANRLGYRAYIVGGVVRDILLGKDVWDLDFVIEGDAIRVAEELAREHGVQPHPFPEFGTAHVKVGSLKLEFATARRETYPRPGAYPKVEKASLKEDLVRRDFTINAMAISVNPEDMGTLIDYFGGIRDLKDKIVRVLHPVSFIEDPVRILRALRFAGRLGFKLSKSTERLLKQAVNLGLLEEAPRGRIMNEIRLALREDRLLEILSLYRKFKVLEHVIKGFRWTQNLEDRLINLKKVTDWHSLEFPSERVDYGWVFLMVILSTVKPEVSERFLQEVSAPSWVRESMESLYTSLNALKDKLQRAERNSEVYRALKGVHISLLLILMTCRDVQDKVKLFLERLRFVKAPPEAVSQLKSKGLEGRELGEEIERLKERIMDEEKSFIMERS